MSAVNITIDGVAVGVEADTTILNAAKFVGIRIPTLCNHPSHFVKANCRVCLVDVGGKLLPSCATKVTEGMSVQTQNTSVIAARKTSLALILSHHPMDCQHCARNGACEVMDLSDEMCSYCYFCDCVQDGNCELQDLAREMNVTFGDFPWTQRTEELDESTVSIVKDPNKCILCRRCIGACSEVLGIHAWSFTSRGEHSKIVPALGVPLSESPCVQCGQCVRDCPTGALSAKQQFMNLLEPIDDKNITVVGWIDPNFLPEFATLGGYTESSLTEKNIVAGLHRLGVDVVLSGADTTCKAISQIAQELEHRLMDSSIHRPLIGFSSFAAKTYVQRNYPELAANLSATLSPQQLFGEYCKGEWATQQNLKAENIYTVSLNASLSSKAEAVGKASNGAVDLVLTPLELGRMFLRGGADLKQLKPEDFDLPAEYSKPPVMSPDHGGIMIGKISGEKRQYKVAAAQGLGQARILLEEVKAGKSPYAFIYLSACPGEGVNLAELLYPFGSMSIVGVE